MQIHHIHMDVGSFHDSLLTHRKLPLDLTEACGTDAQALRSDLTYSLCLFPLTAHHQKSQVPGNRSLHIYQNRMEQFLDLVEPKGLTSQTEPPHKYQTVHGKASGSCSVRNQDTLASGTPLSTIDWIPLIRYGMFNATPFQ